MGNIKQVNIKNCTNYFLMTWLILKILIQSINSVNPSYFTIGKVYEYIEEKT